jgi:hypothetical protein
LFVRLRGRPLSFSPTGQQLLAGQVKIKDESVRSTTPGTRSRDTTVNAVCDVCGEPHARGERRRLVWASGPDGDLVLADLCARCAGESHRFLVMYGGRGRDAVRLTHESSVSVKRAPVPRAAGMFVRGLLYVLVAVAAFVLVTLLTARG